jgi:hypothetical protein
MYICNVHFFSAQGIFLYISVICLSAAHLLIALFEKGPNSKTKKDTYEEMLNMP